MKKVFYLLLFLPVYCQAKGPCPGITFHKDKQSGIITYASPRSSVMATKLLTKSDTSIFLNFSVDGGSETPDDEEPELVVSTIRGLSVQFSDGGTWSNDTAFIRHHLRGGTSVFSFALKMNDKTFDLFTSKTIAQFTLAGLTQKEITQAGLIARYLICLKEQEKAAPKNKAAAKK
jgi:hypothetical protein